MTINNVNKNTKFGKLVTFLSKAEASGRKITSATVSKRFGGDATFVTYFHGLKRNGAVDTFTGKVNGLNGAVSAFRAEARNAARRG